MNTWWADNPSERYWLEVTDRPDVGADLKAPLLDESGKDNWRYSLFQHARVGDIVFHYKKPAIIGFSVIAGPSVQAEITWVARGTYARSKGTEPHVRPGYRIPLSDFTPLDLPITLEDLRKQRAELERIFAAESAKYKGGLYFPFELSASRDLRLLQGYAFKLPASLVELMPELRGQTVDLATRPIGEPVSSSVVAAEATRNPPWSRDELILALDLYIKHRFSLPSKTSEAVADLSTTLNAMGMSLGQLDNGTYRNTNGVYMKLMNFRRFDSEYTADGKVGLTRGNKDEEKVWDEFAKNEPRLTAVASAIKATVLRAATEGALLGEAEYDIQEAEEGRVLTRVHRVRERDRRLVAACKQRALKLTGRLTCAACDFDFLATYGPSGAGIIDVHHTKPLHTLGEGAKTRVEDLSLLCPNCHRVVHSTRKWLTIGEVRDLLQSQRGGAKTEAAA